ncbi:MAG: DUF4185 domain-containing protein [Myxococcaceae bacterium]
MPSSRVQYPAFAAALCLVAQGCGNPPAVRVLEAQELGIVSQSSLIVGRDGAGSALLWGRSVWVFGDTVSSVPDEAGETWHNNSFALTSNLSAGGGVTLTTPADSAGAPVYFLPPTGDEATFIAAHAGSPCQEAPCGARFAAWPAAPVFDAARSRALVPYSLVWAAPGSFNFYGVGQSFAVWDGISAAVERPIVSPGATHPTLLFGQDEPGFGTATAVEGDELFAFGCVQDGLTFHCLLAEVALEAVFDRSAWRYWDGTAWSTSLSAARPVFDASSIVSVAYNAYLGQWIAIYSAVLSNDVLIRTAPQLVGPWSDPTRLLTADRRGLGGTSYDAQAHAELAEEGGQVLYVTYSRPNGNGLFGLELALVRVSVGKP